MTKASETADRPGASALVRRGPVPVSIRSLAQRMLAKGATPEEIVARARAQGSGRITEATLKRWIGLDPKLRDRQRRRQVSELKLLEQKLEGGGPGKARLLDAAHFAGLALPPGSGSRLDLPRLVELHSSMWDSLQRENIALKHRALQLEAQKDSISRRIEAVRTVVDRMRWQAVQNQLDQLWDFFGVRGSGPDDRGSRPGARGRGLGNRNGARKR